MHVDFWFYVAVLPQRDEAPSLVHFDFCSFYVAATQLAKMSFDQNLGLTACLLYTSDAADE